MTRQWLPFSLCCLMWTCPLAWGQTLSLSERATGATSVTAEVGEEVEIAVFADLGRFSATGVSLYIRLPSSPFTVVDAGPDNRPGIQPFRAGPLFDGGMEAENDLVPEEALPSLLDGEQMLIYSVVLGPGKDRGRQGSGMVATFTVRFDTAVDALEIAVESTPVHETRLVLEDGRSERRFTAMGGMSVTSQVSTVVDAPASWATIKSLVGGGRTEVH